MQKWIFYSFFLLQASLSLHAKPKGGKIVHGAGKWEEHSGGMRVFQHTEKMILEWKSFSVEKGKEIQFLQPSKKGAILNRVVGTDRSELMGKITANGKVYVLNPNGILIGPEGKIHTSGFIASTLNLLDEDFIAGKKLTFFGKGGAVQNEGEVHCVGNVYFLGDKIENRGVVHAEGGDISFFAKKGLLTTHPVVNHSGILCAQGIENRGGQIVLSAKEGSAEVCGKIEATKGQDGGHVEVLGKEVEIKKGAHLSTDALANGNGGKILLLGEERALFEGSASARGGALSGNGGFIELSSPKLPIYSKGTVDTRAPHGKWGEFLLDPSNITISIAGTSPAFTPPTYNPSGVPSATLNNGDLQNALATSNITVATSNGLGGSGTITVANNVTWDAATTLSLIADRDLVVNSGVTISNTHTGSGPFTAMHFENKGTVSGNYNGTISHGILESTTGTIHLIGQGGSTGGGNSGIAIIDSGARVRSIGVGADAAPIILEGTAGAGVSAPGIIIRLAQITSIDGDISLVGNVPNGIGSNYGVVLDQGGSVHSTGTGAEAANITITGTSLGTGNAIQGVRLFTSGTQITSIDGDISIFGESQGTGTDCHGIHLNAGTFIQTTGDANIVSTSTGGGTNGSGIFFSSAQMLSGSGNIAIEATSSGPGANAIALTNAADRIGGVTASGNITISADTLTLAGQVQSTGSLIMQPIDPSASMGIGTGAVGTFNLDNTELATLQDGFSSITFGRTDGAHTVDLRAFTLTDPVTVQGDTISVNSPISSGTNPMTLHIGTTNAGTLNLNAAVTANPFQVEGGSGNDTFNVNITGQQGTFDGEGGTNTLNGPSSTNTWTITGNNGGTLDAIAFSNIQQLNGNSGNDNFTFTGAFQVSGSPGIDGGGGGNKITGSNVQTIWTISGNDAGSLTPAGSSGATTFINIASLTGGSGTDIFDDSSGFTLSGTIDGGGGRNTFVGPNTATTWNLTTDNGGNAAGNVFVNITDLVGGSGDDDFVFSNGVSLLGRVSGGGGNNTLDYTAFTTTVQINTTEHTASNLGAGYLDIQNFLGNVEFITTPIPSPLTIEKLRKLEALNTDFLTSLNGMERYFLLWSGYEGVNTMGSWLLHPYRAPMLQKWDVDQREMQGFLYRFQKDKKSLKKKV